MLQLEQLEDRTVPASPYVENELLVQFRPGVDAAQQNATLRGLNAVVSQHIISATAMDLNQGALDLIRLPSNVKASDAISYLQSQPGVEFAEYNWRYTSTAISNDPYYTTSSRMWGMYSDDTPTNIGPTGTTNQYGTHAEEAWNAGHTGSETIYVGVIDEGIQITHPDLAANVWNNPFDPVDGVDNDGNGYIDDTNGWDFFHNDRTVYDSGDGDDHGTHVAGTIGGVGGNGQGVVGVNWDVTMISLKFLGPNGGTTAGAVSALNYLRDLKSRHGINIVATNNSWGGGGYSSSLHTAIIRAAKDGILFIAAAGNGGSDFIGDNNDNGAFYPSNYNTTVGTSSESAASYDSVIAVASITSSGAKSSFSNYGKNTVDIGAPGSGIWSTVPNNSYAGYSGTSMATPHVTGAAALYASVYPNATGSEIRTALLSSATPTTSLNGITVTGGRLNVYNAIQIPPGATLSINDVAATEGNSGNKSFTFTVSLSSAATQTVTVDYTTAAGTATAGSDYATTSGTVTFNVGDKSKTVTVNVIGDSVIENNETFFVNLSNAKNATIGDGQGLGTIQNDDFPAISIGNVSLSEGNSGKKAFDFTVTLSEAALSAVTVNYATAAGTATAGNDYTTTSGTLTFDAGQTSKTISVSVNGDTSIEENETFFVNLTNPTNATIADGQGLGTILNDDLAQLTIDNVAAAETNSGTTSFTFTVTLSQAVTNTVTVDYATVAGSATAGGDYTPINGALTFNPGDTSKTVVVSVIGDTAIELDETFFVNLSNVSGAEIADGSGLGTIQNDDFPTFSITDVSAVETNSGTTTFTFTIGLSAASPATITVDYATADGTAAAGSDYTGANGTLTFNPGDTSKTVSVTVNGDTAIETSETFFVNLSNAVNALIADGQGQGTIINDDFPTISIGDVTAAEGDSGTTDFTFTINLSEEFYDTVTVDYATAAGSAASDIDFVSGSGVVTFAAGETSKPVVVSVIGDADIESAETFFVNLSNPTNAGVADGQGLGTIVDDDLPSLSIDDVSALEGNSGTTTFTFTVSLSEASNQVVTVDYATANGTAAAGSDYVSANGTLTFNSGVTSQTVSVTVNGDTSVESTETFFVNLSNAVNASVADGQGLGTILYDDLPQLAVDNVSAVEGNSGTTTFTFTISLSDAFDQTVTVDYATAAGSATAGSDYTSKSGTVTFSAGETSKTVSVSVTGETAIETDESFFLNLSNPSNATIADGQGVGTIINDDFPQITITDVSLAEGNSGSKSFVFTVSLSEAFNQAVTVNYATAAGTAASGSDFTATSGTLTFAVGETSKTVSVSVLGDTAIEQNETFFVNLSNATNAVIADAQGVGTIQNDDFPQLTITDVSAAEGNSGSKSFVFTVNLSEAFFQAVTVDYATAAGSATAGSDYTTTSGTLTFNAGDTSKTISVSVSGDATVELDETFFVNLSNATNATISDGQGLGTIQNDDTPELSINDVTANEGNSGLTSFTFTVTLSQASPVPVTVNYATANGSATAGSDYNSTSGTLTFNVGDTSKTVTVSVIGDTTVEPSETFFVNLSLPTNALINDGQGQGTINNDDGASLSINDVSLTEGNSGSKVFTFTVTLSQALTTQVTVSAATANGTAIGSRGPGPGADYQNASVFLTFTPGQTTKSVSVNVFGDLAVEADETFFVNLSNAVGATISDSQGVGTILNDDLPMRAAGGAGLGGDDATRVTNSLLRSYLDNAIARWKAVGVSGAGLAALQSVKLKVDDLPDDLLGVTSGDLIRIDRDAAGYGWFLDSTPDDDSEFTTAGDQGEQGRMDLMTVLMHELGNRLGVRYREAGVMSRTLELGARYLPAAGDLGDGVFVGPPTGAAAKAANKIAVKGLSSGR